MAGEVDVLGIASKCVRILSMAIPEGINEKSSVEIFISANPREQ